MKYFLFLMSSSESSKDLCWTPEPPMRSATLQLHPEDTQQLGIPRLDRYMAVPGHGGRDWFVCVRCISCLVMFFLRVNTVPLRGPLRTTLS